MQKEQAVHIMKPNRAADWKTLKPTVANWYVDPCVQKETFLACVEHFIKIEGFTN